MSFFFFKQKTAYEMRISDWSSDVCSSDLQFDQRHRRRIEVLRAVLFNRPGDIFAQLHTELIEGVDTHQHRVDERALFVKCDQRTQYFRRYIVEQKGRGWSVAGIGTRRIFIIVPPLHQRRRLRETIDKQGTVMRRIKGIRSEEHTSELQSLMRITYAVFCLQ